MAIAANYKPNVEIVSDAEEFARRSVEIFISDAQKAIDEKDVFYVAISGGLTPRHFFEMLGKNTALPWKKIQLFWVDERYVPLDSQWSNYKLAADTFLSKVPIPAENVHRIPTEHSDVTVAANLYEEIIRNVFRLEEGIIPQFDLVVLGMGADGHTGSLFPSSYARFNTSDLACVIYVMDERLNRITLTHPVLCAAKHIAVLITGEEKAGILKKVLTSKPNEVKFPIHILWPVLDKVAWLTDKSAAKQL